jgi:hypothetical protein
LQMSFCKMNLPFSSVGRPWQSHPGTKDTL